MHQLRIELIKLRHELTNKNQTIGRLKFLCRERMTRIDDLNGKVEQSRQQIRRLDLQNQILIEMICRLASSITDAAKGVPQDVRGAPLCVGMSASLNGNRSTHHLPVLLPRRI